MPTKAARCASSPAAPSGRRTSSSPSPRSRRSPTSRASRSAWCRCTRARRSSSPTSPRPAASSSSEVKVEAVGGSPTRQRLLKEKKIDAGLQPYPLSYEAEAAGLTNLGPIAKLVPGLSVHLGDGRRGLGEGEPRGAGRLSCARCAKAPTTCSRIPTSPPRSAPRSCAPPLPSRGARIEDTATMDIMSRDLSVAPASLQRVFDIMQAGRGHRPRR